MERWRRGAGTFISFTIALVCMMSVFFFGLSIVQENIGQNEMELAAELICRDLVVCGSLREAQELAESEAREYFSADRCGNIQDVSTEVFLLSGSEDTWTRGDYVVLYLSASVDGLMFPSRNHTVRDMAMVEHGQTAALDRKERAWRTES